MRGLLLQVNRVTYSYSAKSQLHNIAHKTGGSKIAPEGLLARVWRT